MKHEEIIAAAREVIEANHTFVMATVGEDGAPRLRWMGDLVLEEPLTITMAARAASRKMDQIRRNPQGQLLFNNAEYERVVTLSGEYEIIEDRETRQRIWDAMPSLRDFASGPQDPEVALIRFTTRRVELLVLREHGETPLVAEL